MINAYDHRMNAPVVEVAPALAAAHLTVALGKLDRLLRVETRRAQHIQLSAVRAELAEGIAHLGSAE